MDLKNVARKSISKWTTDDILDCLKKNNLSGCGDAIKRKQVDGSSFLEATEHKVLFWGVPRQFKRSLLHLIEDLNKYPENYVSNVSSNTITNQNKFSAKPFLNENVSTNPSRSRKPMAKIPPQPNFPPKSVSTESERDKSNSDFKKNINNSKIVPADAVGEDTTIKKKSVAELANLLKSNLREKFPDKSFNEGLSEKSTRTPQKDQQEDLSEPFYENIEVYRKHINALSSDSESTAKKASLFNPNDAIHSTNEYSDDDEIYENQRNSTGSDIYQNEDDFDNLYETPESVEGTSEHFGNPQLPPRPSHLIPEVTSPLYLNEDSFDSFSSDENILNIKPPESNQNLQERHLPTLPPRPTFMKPGRFVEESERDDSFEDSFDSGSSDGSTPSVLSIKSKITKSEQMHTGNTKLKKNTVLPPIPNHPRPNKSKQNDSENTSHPLAQRPMLPDPGKKSSRSLAPASSTETISNKTPERKNPPFIFPKSNNTILSPMDRIKKSELSHVQGGISSPNEMSERLKRSNIKEDLMKKLGKLPNYPSQSDSPKPPQFNSLPRPPMAKKSENTGSAGDLSFIRSNLQFPKPPRHDSDSGSMEDEENFYEAEPEISQDNDDDSGDDYVPPITPVLSRSPRPAQTPPVHAATRPLPKPPIDNASQWFVETDRIGAERRLRGRPNGSFLFRPSSKPEYEKTLSIIYEQETYNIPILKRPNGQYALGLVKENEVTFANLDELVQYYNTEKLVLYRNQNKSGSVYLNTSMF